MAQPEFINALYLDIMRLGFFIHVLLIVINSVTDSLNSYIKKMGYTYLYITFIFSFAVVVTYVNYFLDNQLFSHISTIKNFVDKDLSVQISNKDVGFRFFFYISILLLLYGIIRKKLMVISYVLKGKSLKKDIKNIIKNRKAWKQKRSSIVVVNKFAFLLMLIFSLQSLYFLVLEVLKNITSIQTFKQTLFLIGSVCAASAFYMRIKKPSVGNTEQDMWEKGRSSFFFYICSFSFMVSALLIDNSALSVFQKVMLSSSLVIFVFVVIIVLYISINPRYILKGSLTHVGTYLVFYSFILTPFSIIVYPRLGLLSFFILFLSIILATKLSTISIKQNINVIQFSVLGFIRPDMILELFKSEENKIKEEIKALKILKELDEKDRFGVEKYLLVKLTDKYSNKNTKFHSIITSVSIALVVTVITAVIQLIIQDTVYSPMLKKYICQVFICSN